MGKRKSDASGPSLKKRIISLKEKVTDLLPTDIVYTCKDRDSYIEIIIIQFTDIIERVYREG